MASKYKPNKIYLKMEIILLCILLVPVIVLTWGIAFIICKEVIEEFKKK